MRDIDRPDVTRIVCLFAAVAAAGLAWQRASAYPCRDLYVIWSTARSVQEGGPDPWSEKGRAETFARRFDVTVPNVACGKRYEAIAARQRVYLPRNTPLAVAFVDFVVGPDYDAGVVRWQALGLAAYIAAIFLLCRLFGLPATMSFILAAALLTVYGPADSDARVGNLGRLQLLIMTGAAVLLARRNLRGHVIAGALVAFAVILKPTAIVVPALLVVSRIANRRWKELVLELSGGCFGAAFCLAFVGLWISDSCWVSWLTYFASSFSPTLDSIGLGNNSLSRILEEATGLSLEIPIVLAALTAASAAIWVSRRKGEDSDERLTEEVGFAVAASLTASLLGMRLVWTHYLTMLVPMILFAFRPRASSFCVFSGLLALALTGGTVMVQLFPATAREIAWLAITGTAVLFLSCLWTQVKNSREQRGGASDVIVLHWWEY